MNYTDSQTRAISSRKPEVLVSAAAGSGKTRVLTERVELLVRGADMDVFREEKRKTTDPDRMEDISHMLMVTFTRAAASEMRTRIVQALNEAAQDEPDPAAAERLRIQSEAAAGADITTIDGFCRKVVSENYEEAGVAAGFSVLNDSRSDYLRSISVREVFDGLYAERDEDARRLLARYGSKGDDTALLGLVTALYAQMMSHADPEGWLTRSLEDPEVYVERLHALRREAAHRQLKEVLAAAARLTAREASDPVVGSTRTASRDAGFLDALQELQHSFADGRVPAALPDFPRIAPREADAMEPVRQLRERAKEMYRELKPLLAAQDTQADLEDIRHTQEDVRALVKAVQLFAERYEARKAAANGLDFADLEHRALRVLKKRGNVYAQKYRHIFVDEYQDTNPVQEAILAAIHLDADGQPLNSQFLVGDMKQSIYGFRFADPTIFDGKSRSFALEAGPGSTSELIRMNDNFRSSPAVVCGVNAIMGELMDEDLGDVPYTEGERLVCGRTDMAQGACRILLAEPAGSGGEAVGESEADRKAQAEAEMIASEIEALHAGGRDYGDIAVLFRSRSATLWALASALEARGIPAAAQSGYTTMYVELEVFLNLLRLVVNERQDVPLLSVLRSFLFGFDEQELAWIAEFDYEEAEDAADAPNRLRQLPQAEPAPERDGDLPFFRRLERFRQRGPDMVFSGPEQQLHCRVLEKVENFEQQMASLRSEGTDMSLVRFAEAAANRFSLPSHLLTRPNGTARRRMYEELLKVMGEQQLLHGNSLLRILDAVDELRKQGKLFSEERKTAQLPGVVRLMTVHGSKGLEFPVVFLAGLHNAFSRKATEGSVLRSDRFGVTVKYIDPDSGERRDTLETQMVKDYLQRQQRSEELRLLYVAMTRAQETLYLCGVGGDPDKDMQRWSEVQENKQRAGSSLDWVMSAWLSLRERGEEAAVLFADAAAPAEAGAADAPAETHPFDWHAFADALRRRGTERPLHALEPRVRVAAQQGVSKLSEQDFAASGRAGAWQRRQIRPVVDQDPEITGARRGTLLHRFMRYAVSRGLDADQTLAAMTANRLISPEEGEALSGNLAAVQRFLDSDLYVRVRASRKVLTEQRFTLLVDANEIDPDVAPGTGKVQLRGMIDLAFLEEDGWVLLDYKTDRAEDVELVKDRYREQLAYYSRALSELTGFPVKEQRLYLFERGESVLVPA